jgi:hypothetical protein
MSPFITSTAFATTIAQKTWNYGSVEYATDSEPGTLNARTADFHTTAINQVPRMVEVTLHAIQRFQERYARCSKREAREMLRVAYIEAKPPPKYVRRKYFHMQKIAFHGGCCLYHKFSGLLLVCRPGLEHPHCIVTVISIPFPMEVAP